MTFIIFIAKSFWKLAKSFWKDRKELLEVSQQNV